MLLQGVGVIIMEILILVTFGMENKFYEMLVKEGIQCTAVKFHNLFPYFSASANIYNKYLTITPWYVM